MKKVILIIGLLILNNTYADIPTSEFAECSSKKGDLDKLILRIKESYNQGYVIFINLDRDKLKSVFENLNIIESILISKTRNIIFCSIEK